MINYGVQFMAALGPHLGSLRLTSDDLSQELPQFLNRRIKAELGEMSVQEAVDVGETHAELLALLDSLLQDAPAAFVKFLRRMERKRQLVRMRRGPCARRSRLRDARPA